MMRPGEAVRSLGTFRSLRNRNYRLFFSGQIVSLTGTWMQSVGQAWLILELTHSALALGFTAALQFLPMLVLGPWGGLIADRVDKRKLLMGTQAAAATLALILGVLTVTHHVHPWVVYLMASLLGLVNVVDMPGRQSFVMEMVGPRDVTNAVSLNSVVVNGARIVGPAVAGLLIATVGIGLCFLANAVSYMAVIVALVAMRPAELRRDAPMARAKGQLREGFRYVWGNPELRDPLLMMLVVGTLAYNFSVVLPLVAKDVFHRGALEYGWLFSLMGAGAVIGGLVVASRGRASRTLLTIATGVFGLAILGAAVAPTLTWELVAMVPMGAASTVFIATSNALLQLGASPQMRGRVMALFAVVFLGSTPIGGPLVGWIAERFGPRVSLDVAGIATVLTGVVGWFVLRRSLGRTRRGEAGEGSARDRTGQLVVAPTRQHLVDGGHDEEREQHDEGHRGPPAHAGRLANRSE
jgi:MFS family permease